MLVNGDRQRLDAGRVGQVEGRGAGVGGRAGQRGIDESASSSAATGMGLVPTVRTAGRHPAVLGSRPTLEPAPSASTAGEDLTAGEDDQVGHDDEGGDQQLDSDARDAYEHGDHPLAQMLLRNVTAE